MKKRDWSDDFKIWYDSKYDIGKMDEKDYYKVSASFGAGWHLREEESEEKRVDLIKKWKSQTKKEVDSLLDTIEADLELNSDGGTAFNRLKEILIAEREK